MKFTFHLCEPRACSFCRRNERVTASHESVCTRWANRKNLCDNLILSQCSINMYTSGKFLFRWNPFKIFSSFLLARFSFVYVKFLSIATNRQSMQTLPVVRCFTLTAIPHRDLPKDETYHSTLNAKSCSTSDSFDDYDRAEQVFKTGLSIFLVLQSLDHLVIQYAGLGYLAWHVSAPSWLSDGCIPRFIQTQPQIRRNT